MTIADREIDPTDPDFAVKDVFRCLWQVARATRCLPGVRLTPGERMALSGYTFVHGIDLVWTTAEALSREPEIFPDVSLCPGEVKGRLHRSLALSCLGDLLHRLADHATDLALLDRADAVKACFQVVLHVREDRNAGFPTPNAERRRRAMIAPEKALRDRQEHGEKVARKHDRLARKSAATAAGEPSSPRTRAPKKAPSASFVLDAQRSLQAIFAGTLGAIATRAGLAQGVANLYTRVLS